jgi:hypothetical protein
MINLETLDRTIFELIRLKLVALGNLPNWRGLSGTLAQKQVAYEAAKAAIRASGKEVIDLYSTGSTYSREDLSKSKIVINRKNIGFGDIGANGTVAHTQLNGTTYEEQPMPDSSTHVRYEIRCISDKSTYERVIYGAIQSALGMRRMTNACDWANGWKFDLEPILIVHSGYVDVSGGSELMEYLFTYEVKDVWLTIEPTKTIPALNTIDISTTIIN